MDMSPAIPSVDAEEGGCLCGNPDAPLSDVPRAASDDGAACLAPDAVEAVEARIYSEADSAAVAVRIWALVYRFLYGPRSER